jgi:hypothetical protein
MFRCSQDLLFRNQRCGLFEFTKDRLENFWWRVSEVALTECLSRQPARERFAFVMVSDFLKRHLFETVVNGSGKKDPGTVDDSPRPNGIIQSCRNPIVSPSCARLQIRQTLT